MAEQQTPGGNAAAIPVGLDIGTGFTKASGNGRRSMFPSLYSCILPSGIRDVRELDGGQRPVRGLVEEVGLRAQKLSLNKNAVLVRPVKHGMPYMRRGYSRLAAAAVSGLGIRDTRRTVVCAGITYDMHDQRNAVKGILQKAIPGASVVVAPQALGTLMSAGRSEGTVVNIGHGTTEILQVRNGTADGVSIPKASEFVTGQLAGSRADRMAYTRYDTLFAKNQSDTRKLVALLAEHVADELVRMDYEDVILAGGGSAIPGMADALRKIIGRDVVPVDDPVMSNAVGLERKAAEVARRMSGTAGKPGAPPASVTEEPPSDDPR